MADKRKRQPRKKAKPTDLNLIPSEQVEKLAYSGWSMQEISEFYGISVSQLNNFILQNVEGIGDAYQKGTDEACRRVERALFEKAVGYSHPETKVFSNKVGSVKDNSERIEITEVSVIKHYPPDTPACIFYLTNKKREEWKHRFELETLNNGKLLPDMSNLTFNDLLTIVNTGSSRKSSVTGGNNGINEKKVSGKVRKKLTEEVKKTAAKKTNNKNK